LGLGLHTVGDFLPHANLSGKYTFGHEDGYNEDFSKSSGFIPDADFTSKNPMKALATFERFREMWSQYTGMEYSKLSLDNPNTKLLADFIFTEDNNSEGKKKTAAAGLKAIGVTDDEINDVLKFYEDPSKRTEAMEHMKATLPGGDAIALANGIWLGLKNNSAPLNNAVLVNLKNEWTGIARITTSEFEKRRERNWESAVIEERTYIDKNIYSPSY